MGLDLAFCQGLHTVHETVPLADSNTELAFDGLGIEAGGVWDFDGASTSTRIGTLQCNCQGVVAHHTDGGRNGHGGEGSVA